MNKTVLPKVLFGVKGTGRVVFGVINIIVYITCVHIATDAIESCTIKRISRVKKARGLAKLRGMKEGEMLDIFNVEESGLPGSGRIFLTDISVYKVVSVKNGKYKMRYIGSRSYTSAELQKLANEVIT